MAAGATSTFQILFHPTAEGLRQATVTIEDNDGALGNFTFEVQGTGTDPGPSSLTIDDSTSGFQGIGGWVQNSNSLADQGEMLSDAAGQGADQAIWSFNGLAPGNYTVYTTWVWFLNRATNAPFTISTGSATTTVPVNQQQSPSTPIDSLNWQSLGSVDASAGTISVTLTNQANGYVIADAVMIVSQNDPPPASSSSPPPSASAVAHNAALPEDVNGDGIVSNLDALIEINALNSQGSATPAVASSGNNAPEYWDVIGDGVLSSLDVLMIINYLNSQAANASVAVSAGVTTTPVAPAARSASSSASPASLAAVDQAIGELSDQQQATASAAVGPAASAGTPTSTAASGTSAVASTPLSIVGVRAFFASTSKKK